MTRFKEFDQFLDDEDVDLSSLGHGFGAEKRARAAVYLVRHHPMCDPWQAMAWYWDGAYGATGGWYWHHGRALPERIEQALSEWNAAKNATKEAS